MINNWKYRPEGEKLRPAYSKKQVSQCIPKISKCHWTRENKQRNPIIKRLYVPDLSQWLYQIRTGFVKYCWLHSGNRGETDCVGHNNTVFLQRYNTRRCQCCMIPSSIYRTFNSMSFLISTKPWSHIYSLKLHHIKQWSHIYSLKLHRLQKYCNAIDRIPVAC